MQERENSPADSSSEATVSIEIDADIEQVWQALTSDEGLAGWMGDGSTVGAHPGDDVFFADVVTGTPKRGRISEIEHGSHLRYSWWPDADEQERAHVSITLEPVETGTRVVVVESRPVAAHATTSNGQASTVSMASWSWRCALLMLATQLVVTPALVRLA